MGYQFKDLFVFFIVKDEHNLLACHTCTFHVYFCVLHTCRDGFFISLLKVHPIFHSWMLCVHSAIFDRCHDLKTRMYDNTWLASPLLHYMWCGRLVYRLEKLTLVKIYLKNRKCCLIIVYLYNEQSLSLFWFCCIVPEIAYKIACLEITQTKQYIIRQSSTDSLIYMMKNELVEACRVSSICYMYSFLILAYSSPAWWRCTSPNSQDT